MSARKIREWAWPYIKNFRTYIDVGALDGDTAKPFVNNFEKISDGSGVLLKDIVTAMIIKDSSKEKWKEI